LSTAFRTLPRLLEGRLLSPYAIPPGRPSRRSETGLKCLYRHPDQMLSGRQTLKHQTLASFERPFVLRTTVCPESPSPAIWHGARDYSEPAFMRWAKARATGDKQGSLDPLIQGDCAYNGGKCTADRRNTLAAVSSTAESRSRHLRIWRFLAMQ
jgi:hypothetical protein